MSQSHAACTSITSNEEPAGNLPHSRKRTQVTDRIGHSLLETFSAAKSPVFTSGGCTASAAGSRSRRFGERISSGRRTRVCGWERHGGRRDWSGMAALQQLRSVVNPSERNSTSRRWFALVILCQVEPVLGLPKERISRAITTPPIRLCVRTKIGECPYSGSQSMFARVATAAASKPAPVYRRNLTKILNNSPVCKYVPHWFVPIRSTSDRYCVTYSVCRRPEPA